MTVASVYVETSVISALAARPSRDLIVAAHQRLTQDCWDAHRPRFRAVTSPLVLREAGLGDEAAAAMRLDLLRELPLLEISEGAADLARAFLEHGPILRKAEPDAAHVAVAAVHGIDYLLTWNCRHVANAEMQFGLSAVCLAKCYRLPVLCTPEQLMGRE